MTFQKVTFWFHDGEEDFLHGAGPSDPGWYVYFGEVYYTKWPRLANTPDGPFSTFEGAASHASSIMGGPSLVDENGAVPRS